MIISQKPKDPEVQSSRQIALQLAVFLIASSAILFYPFYLFFTGKWEARPYVNLLSIDTIRGWLGKNANNSNIVAIGDFLAQNGIDSIGFRYYSLCLFIGAIIALYIMIQLFKKIAVSEVTSEKIFVSMILIGLLGARLGFILVNYQYFLEKPIEVVNFQQGGLSLYGGIALVSLYLFYYSKRFKFSFLQLTDSLVPSALVIMILARFGNFFNYEAYGPATSLPFRMYVPEGAVTNNRYNTSGVLERFYHPTFLYEMIINFVLLVLLTYNYDKWHRRSVGRITSFFLIGYGIGRFYLEYLRLDATRLNASLTVGQVISIIFILLGLVFFEKSLRNNLTRVN
jgi:phosphatidylglycerol---prolipoprotein diacylglyceryl transferase